MARDKIVFSKGFKGIEHGRAEFAYRCVEGVKRNNNIKNSNYKSYVKKVPMLIKTNGLGATYAFIYSKDDEAYKEIYRNTKEWLECEDGGLIDLSGNECELVKKIIELPSSKYRAVTIEILALFQWLRRFAEGMLEE